MAVPEGEGKVSVGAEQLGGLLRDLEETQRSRAEEYARLNASFHRLLKDQDELAYRRTLAESTTSFQQSSSAVRAIISILDRSGVYPEVCALLRDMQTKEQAKLKFTLILQALRAAGSEEKFSWQQPGAEESSVLDAVQSLESKGPTGRGGAGCGCGASKAQEPTEEEFNGAVTEATRELQAAVTEINGILEELQYLKEDCSDSA